MVNNERRSPLGIVEDDNTIYQFTDWTSASKMRNYLNPLLRVDVGIVRKLTEEINEIEGYQITVYNVNTQVIVYKFYVNYIEEGVWCLNTEEALAVLNSIGFRCEYNETVVLTDRAREILEACKSMGYTHIKRIVGAPDYLLIVSSDAKNAEIVTGHPLRDLLSHKYKYINLYDFRFIGVTPVNIEEILK